jgi:N-acetylmuramoyl-L-alanine amidase
MLTFLLTYLAKATLLSGILYAYYHFTLRDKQTFRWNRFYLLAATAVSIGVPLLNIPLRMHMTVAGTPTLIHLLKVIPGRGEAETEAVAVAATATRVFDWATALLSLYGAVALALLGVVAYHVGALSRLGRLSERRQLDDITLISTDTPGTPFSFFRWIFWDRALSIDSDSGRAIFRHELAHVRQRHSVDKVLLQVLCAVLFPVYPLYLIRRELQLVHEYLADQEAAGNKDAEAYARYLIEHALHARSHTLANAFYQHPLAKRIAMIQQTLFTQGHAPAWSRWLALPLFCGGFGLFAFTLQRYPPPTPTRTLTVVIDAGHGGKDPGAIGGGVQEKNIDLAIAQDVARLAPGYPVKVLLSRNTDTLIPVQKRIDFAAEHQADLFVSIHVNVQVNGHEQSGLQDLVSLRNRFADSSIVLGSLLAQRLGTVYTTEQLLRQPKTHVGVLDRSVCPAALIQVGYLSNPHDVAFVSAPANQEKIARQILESLTDYVRGTAASKALPVQHP